MPQAESRSTSRILRMGNLAPGIASLPLEKEQSHPDSQITQRRSSPPSTALVAIARNRWSRCVGTGGRDQSESVVAIARCAHHAVDPAPGVTGHQRNHDACAAAVAAALRADLGRSRSAIKVVMQWTGASQRTVKYWFAGRVAPGGAHLATLANHSDAAFSAFLKMSGREHRHVLIQLAEARKVLLEAVRTLDEILPG
jgi:hypothetical protein